jgi:uncharacterized protein (TIGR02391 family)
VVSFAQKQGSDKDGVELASVALSGNVPLLRVNKFQTDTEKSIQKGVHQLVMCMYGAIRNPRSHEQMQDSKESADAIIYFIDYILKVLDASEEPFTVERFMAALFDPDFVENMEYAGLLISEIPKNKLLDTLIEIFRRKLEIKQSRLVLLITEILNRLVENQLRQFLSVVSDELRVTTKTTEIANILEILRPDLWPQLSEVARLRIETKLIKGIDAGMMTAESIIPVDAALATRARDFLPYFSRKTEAFWTIVSKIEKRNSPARTYVANYFINNITPLVEDVSERDAFIQSLVTAIEDGHVSIKSCIRVYDLPEEWRDLLRFQLGENAWNEITEIPF